MDPVPPAPFFAHFGLIVTGKAEYESLDKLFRSLAQTGLCTFQVIERSAQLRPHAASQKLSPIGQPTGLPSRDEKLGLWARTYLAKGDRRFVILVDDLENLPPEEAQRAFNRYRNAFDRMLRNDKHRASVHFLVNALEAYFLADACAVNGALGTHLADWPTDVETIRNPKEALERRGKQQLGPTWKYRERQDGAAILAILDVPHILSQPDRCAALRTLFKWCYVAVSPPDPTPDPEASWRLITGRLYELTRGQVESLVARCSGG